MRILPGRKSSGLLTAALVVVAMGLALFLLTAGISSYERSTVRRAWVDSIGTPEQMFERFPAREPSDSALSLEQLTPTLGIVTVARHRMPTRPPRDARIAAFSEIKREMMDYAIVQLAKTERGIDPAPEIVRAYLDRQAAELAAVRNLLIETDDLYWELELERWFAAPIPNLLGHIDLVKLLLVDALVALDRDQRSRALGDLEAAWKLSHSLRRDPMLITQLITITDARMLNGVLRQVPDLPAVWRERLAAHDYRSSFVQAMEFEAWIWVEAPLGSGFGTDLPQIVDNFAGRVSSPYVRFCMAQASNAMRERLQNLKQVPAICDYDLSASNADLEIELPRWNTIGRMMMPNFSAALNRVARLELDLELTQRVLELDAGLVQSANASSSDRSDACPEDAWLYDWSRPGQVMLSLERTVTWEGLRGHETPRSFSLRRGDTTDRQSI